MSRRETSTAGLRQRFGMGFWLLLLPLLLAGQLLGKGPSKVAVQLHTPDDRPVVRFVSQTVRSSVNRNVPVRHQARIERTPTVELEDAQPSPSDFMLDVTEIAQLPDELLEPPKPAGDTPIFASPEDRSIEGIVSEVQPAKPDLLDVRPRTIDADKRLIDREEELPKDKSGLRGRARVFRRAVDRPPADLRLRHFCAASTFYHHPLYFEDPALERHGYPAGLFKKHPVVRSGAHFFLSAATLPLAMKHQKPCSCVRSGCLCSSCD